MTVMFEPRRNIRFGALLPYVAAMVLVAMVTGAAYLGEDRLSLANLALFYLLPVMLVAGRAGLMPGLFTSAIAALSFNFFLVPPRLTLRIADADNLLTMTVLFVVAVVVSQLGARLRRQAEQAEESSRISASVSAFGERLAEKAGVEAIRSSLRSELAALLGSQVEIDPEDLQGIDAAAANWALANNTQTGRSTSIMANSEWLFAPLVADRVSYGLVAIRRDDARSPVVAGNAGVLDGMLTRSAQALARATLAEERAAIARHRQKEQLRESLLASVGHDLRTPLTAIRAGLDVLREGSIDDAVLGAVRAETARLELMVANLLEMTRIEAGAVTLHLEPTDLTDVVTVAVDALISQIGGRKLVVDLPEDLPLVRTDPRLVQPMLLNLIDNACKYGGDHGQIIVGARSGKDGVALSVTDDGPGIPVGEEARIFDRFARIEGSDRSGGTGLGLAIVRGFGDALGLTVVAANRAGGSGAVFSILFPLNAIIAPPSSVPA